MPLLFDTGLEGWDFSYPAGGNPTIVDGNPLPATNSQVDGEDDTSIIARKTLIIRAGGTLSVTVTLAADFIDAQYTPTLGVSIGGRSVISYPGGGGGSAPGTFTCSYTTRTMDAGTQNVEISVGTWSSGDCTASIDAISIPISLSVGGFLNRNYLWEGY